MGCDIHTIAQVKTDKGWETVATRVGGEPRDYEMYGRLAGVRGDVEPIAYPRSIPDDFEHSKYEQMGGGFEVWHGGDFLGTHSFSWFTLAELKKDPHCKACCCGMGELTKALEVAGEGYCDDHVRVVFGFDS